MDDDARIETVMRYHERTKHHINRYAPGPGELDWANQQNSFRRFEGAPLARLPLLGPDDEPESPRYADLYRRGAEPSTPQDHSGIRSSYRLLSGVDFEVAADRSGSGTAGGGRSVTDRFVSTGARRVKTGQILGG
jgi:hypothetical protein